MRARYGDLTDVLAVSGAFDWFRSPALWVPMALLAVATLVCTLDRWRSLWQRAFHSPLALSDVAFNVAPYTVRLSLPPTVELPLVLRQCLRGLGFRVRTETVGDVLYIRADRHRLTSLATLVTHLAALLMLAGTVLTRAYSWREELSIEPGQTAEVGRGSGLTVRNEGFNIARYLDESVAAYQAQVTVFEGSQEVRRGSLEVNAPLAYKGTGLYLHAYSAREGGYGVILLAVHDPGYGLVIAAGFLLLLGLTASFNFPRGWIQARLLPDGTLHLAGWADRRAYHFQNEFAMLVEDVQNWKYGGTESMKNRHPSQE
jgi:cytochrome c biogenesis protein ResB